MAATASRSSVGVISWGLPPRRPCARAVAKPTLVCSDNQLAPELRDDGEDAEGELGGRRRGVDRGALAGQHLEPDAPPGGLPHQVDWAAEVAAGRSSFRTTGAAPLRGASG